MQESYQVRWFEKKVRFNADLEAYQIVKTLKHRSKQDDGTWGEWQDVETVTEE